MKTLSLFLVALLVLLSISIQTQTNIGGGYELNLKEIKTNPETDVEIDYNYSEIPAEEIYSNWDTHNIHAYDFNRYKLKDTLSLIMIHDSCDFAMPHEGYVTSMFGNRSQGYHHGIDIKLNKGDKVKAAFEGMVRISQYSSSYGNVVVVRHNNGLETLYAHLSKRNVKSGDHVEAGEILGLGGNTGRSSGAHLHFECRYKGEPINPSKIVDFSKGSIKQDTIYLAKNNFKTSKNEAKYKPKAKSVYPAAVIKDDQDDPKKKKAEKAKVNTTVTRMMESEVIVETYTNEVEEVKTDIKDTASTTSASKTKSSVPTTSTVERDPTERRFHKVVKEDTIYSLARKNGVTVDEIKEWNNIKADNIIKLGTMIRVY